MCVSRFIHKVVGYGSATSDRKSNLDCILFEFPFALASCMGYFYDSVGINDFLSFLRPSSTRTLHFVLNGCLVNKQMLFCWLSENNIIPSEKGDLFHQKSIRKEFPKIKSTKKILTT